MNWPCLTSNKEALPLDNPCNHVLLQCWSSESYDSLDIWSASMLWFYSNVKTSDPCCHETFFLKHVKDPRNAEKIKITKILIVMFENPSIQEEELMSYITFFLKVVKFYSLFDSLQKEVESNLNNLIMSSCTTVKWMLCSSSENLHHHALGLLINFMYVECPSNLPIRDWYVNFSILFIHTSQCKEVTTKHILNASPVIALWCYVVISSATSNDVSVVGLQPLPICSTSDSF